MLHPMLALALASALGATPAPIDDLPAAPPAPVVELPPRPLDPSALSAQGSDEKKPPTPIHTGFKALFRNLGEDVAHLPSKPNLYLALAGGAAALAVHPIDDDVNTALKSHYGVVNDIYKPGHIVGQTPVMIGASLLTYVYGRIEHEPKVSHLGMDLVRAQIIDEALTGILKYSVRRERPNGSNNLSFPSGHASITFATATVIERHLGWKASVLGYTFAAYVASSRLHDNVHWMSDVVFGAAVGTISGRTVTEHGRNVWSFAPVPVPGGVAVLATRTAATGSRR